MGRFINADFVGYLGIAGNITGFNLFSYCGNNSVMGYDPQGEWDWGKFINGASLLAIGVIACAAAITVVSGGACAPLLVAATATFVAGGTTVINGASEIVESFTDYNPVRDSLYNGDTEFYETQRDVFATAAEVGTILLTLGSGMMCFVEGTQITTSTGMVNIEDINIGTLVLSSDPYTMNTDYKAVIEVYKSEAYDLATIYINGEEVTTTLNHPFWTEEYGWVGAEYLTPDCTLVLSSGETAHIDHIVIQHYNSPVYVYNFEVEEFHTYYVGNSGVLVHNKNAWDPEVSETIQKLLEGTGQLRNLRNNPNFHGVNIEYLLQRTPAELEQLAKSGIISSKTLKQIKKAFEGQDWGTKGRKC